MNLICKIIGHHWYAMDYLEFGWELKGCRRCNISNYYIDDKHYLHKLKKFISKNEECK